MREGPFFHGGMPHLRSGESLMPAPPRVVDGCPVCVARAEGRYYSVGEYRAWLRLQGPRGLPVLAQLEGADDREPVDPPSKPGCVYITSDREYARWYAARSRGDLYEVLPVGELTASDEDHFPSWTVKGAVVVRAVERAVKLTRTERRAFAKRWEKADRRAARLAVPND